jgi:hypothetical protein
MKAINGFVAIALALTLGAGALACGRDDGTLEKAGEKMDAMVDDITHPGEGPAEAAGRKAGETLDEMKEDLTK